MGVSVNPEGESHHRQARAKMASKEKKNQTRMEKKADGKSLWEEGAEGNLKRRRIMRENH